MKNNIISIYVICVTLALVFSCGSTKPIEKVNGAVSVNVPFSEGKYKSDKNYFRAKQSGISPDLPTAKKVAIMNAKAELSGLVNSTIKSVTDQYTNQRTVGSKLELEIKFEELGREVVNESLVDVNIMDEKVFKETDNNFTYWVAIEMSKDAVLESLANKISNDEKLQLDYDKMKFEQIFNSEMEKLKNE